jgi:glycerol-3-phosphate dehydrogenase (NAD(P)+)
MKVAVIGAGAWGTALAIVLGRKGSHDVRLWAYEKEVLESIEKKRTNDLFLPEQKIPEKVTATNSMEEALRGAQMVVSVMPSHHTRRLFQQMAPYLRPEMLFVSATKGIENDSLLRMTEVIAVALREAKIDRPRIAALSGPSFAKEVARGDPTAVTVASADAELACIAQKEISDPTFRVYTHSDVVGVELGGSLKNVIAIAAGVCDGLGLGYNTVAALITRGLAEMTRVAVACGARAETMSGLAGMGDLVLTCTGGLSRNRTVGVEMGKGKTLEEVLTHLGHVAEGVKTSKSAYDLSVKLEVDMPITTEVYRVLYEAKSPRQAVVDLMTRALTRE